MQYLITESGTRFYNSYCYTRVNFIIREFDDGSFKTHPFPKF